MVLLSWACFIATVLVALVTAPVSRRRGSVATELPFAVLWALAALTGLAFRSAPASVPLAVATVLTAAGAATAVIVTARRGLRARTVLESALRRGGISPARRPRPWIRFLFHPWPLLPRGLHAVGAVSFGTTTGALVDIHLRRRPPPGRAPVLILLHGHPTSTRDCRPLLHRLALRGWVCMSLVTGGSDPLLARQDLHRLVTWVRAHDDDLGIDPQRVVLAGSRWGAAAVIQTSKNLPVRGAVALLDPDHPLRRSEQRAGSAVPLLLIQGERATTETAQFMRYDSQVIYAEIPGAPRASGRFISPYFATVCDAVEDFASAVTAPPA